MSRPLHVRRSHAKPVNMSQWALKRAKRAADRERRERVGQLLVEAAALALLILALPLLVGLALILTGGFR